MRVRGLEGSSDLRVRGIERSSARARVQVVERSSARGRGLDRARRRAESEACGTLLLQYILNYLCHRATWRLIIQRNYTCRCIQASKHAIAKAIARGSEYWRCRDPVIPLRYSDLAFRIYQ